MSTKERIILGTVCATLMVVAFAWAPFFTQAHSVLKVHFLNVGQGDAIFIEAPSGAQVLIDGGRDRSVLRELSAVMPWYDRSIDVMVATHPDADHITGLIDVLERYTVGRVVESSVKGDTDLWRVLETAIVGEHVERTTAMRGQVIELGDGARLEILFPDRLVPEIETNTGSVVVRLVYGDTSFMLTGDSPISIEKYLVLLDDEALQSNVLKAGHHGSRTSSSREFVEAVHPRFAVFSRGCENTYGHPHKEVVELFADLNITTLDTCKNGRISFISDGVEIRED